MRTEYLLCHYWEHLTMVDRSGQYYAALFKGYYRVTQGDPTYPTILNMLADAVIRHWVTVVTGEEA